MSIINSLIKWSAKVLTRVQPTYWGYMSIGPTIDMVNTMIRVDFCSATDHPKVRVLLENGWIKIKTTIAKNDRLDEYMCGELARDGVSVDTMNVIIGGIEAWAACGGNIHVGLTGEVRHMLPTGHVVMYNSKQPLVD